MVAFNEWEGFIDKTSRVNLWLEAIRAIWDDEELDCKSEEYLRKLQNIDLVEFSGSKPELKSNLREKFLKLPKSAIAEGEVADR